MILDTKTTDIHKLFLNLLAEHNYDVFPALREYGVRVSDEIFNLENYSIYKNRYLYWTPELEKAWREYKTINTIKEEFITEEMEFTKAVVHNLIQRIFLNNWSKDEFLDHFEKYIHLLKEGVKYNELR